MLASPVPIYLGCAGLIVGSLGLGAQYMLGGNSGSASSAASERPLFARSVEEASLPESHWSSPNGTVAYYEPMVKLLTTPSRSVPPTTATAPPRTSPSVAAIEVESQPAGSQASENAQQQPRVIPREVVRDVPRQQTEVVREVPRQETKRPKRSKNVRTRDDATAATEAVDPQDAYAKAERDPRSHERRRNGSQQDAAQVDNDRRDPPSRRSERRVRDRDDSEFVETRSRADRRRLETEDQRSRPGERRMVVQEEPGPRIVRPPEQRDGGFSPMRLFGIFDR